MWQCWSRASCVLKQASSFRLCQMLASAAATNEGTLSTQMHGQQCGTLGYPQEGVWCGDDGLLDAASVLLLLKYEQRTGAGQDEGLQIEVERNMVRKNNKVAGRPRAVNSSHLRAGWSYALAVMGYGLNQSACHFEVRNVVPRRLSGRLFGTDAAQCTTNSVHMIEVYVAYRDRQAYWLHNNIIARTQTEPQ
jgi:hypothetical protein